MHFAQWGLLFCRTLYIAYLWIISTRYRKLLVFAYGQGQRGLFFPETL